MELCFLLFQKILSMMLMVFMGYAVVKLGIVDPSQSKGLSGICLYIISPCMILSAFQLEYTDDRLVGLLIAFAGAVLLHIMILLITRLLGNVCRMDRVERASVIYSNGGNLIIPLVSSLLGMEYVLYSCAFVVVQTILMWTHLPRLLTGEKKVDLKKIVLNPNILAVAAGLIMFFCRLQFPSVIGDTVSAVGLAVGPVSMIMLGILMAGIDLKKAFGRPRNGLVVFGKLILYPSLFVLLLSATRVTYFVPGAREVLLITTLAACAPPATTVVQMVNVNGGDDAKAGAVNVMGVLLCCITMPLIVALYQILC